MNLCHILLAFRLLLLFLTEFGSYFHGFDFSLRVSQWITLFCFLLFTVFILFKLFLRFFIYSVHFLFIILLLWVIFLLTLNSFSIILLKYSCFTNFYLLQQPTVLISLRYLYLQINWPSWLLPPKFNIFSLNNHSQFHYLHLLLWADHFIPAVI